jgi:uncharacterized damage-inducible protein DinB
MAAYNRWQNQNLYGAAGGLSDEVRKQQRGPFFGSIAGTLGIAQTHPALVFNGEASRVRPPKPPA